MKSSILILLLFPLLAFSQADHSGYYHFQKKIYYDRESSIRPGKDDQGRSGSLTLLKIDSVKYKFWLQVSKGWPSYNTGTIHGIFGVKNDTALFSHKGDWQMNDEGPCLIRFSFKRAKIYVEQLTGDECGFGAGVYIGDDFYLKERKDINERFF